MLKRKRRRYRFKREAKSPVQENERPRGICINRVYRYEPDYTEEEIFLPVDSCAHQLLFTAHATALLKSFTDWGSLTERNRVEQQGILLGEVYRTPRGFTGVVKEVILSPAVGNSVYIESSHSDWSEMDRRMDELNGEREKKLVKVGWWHTHPNMDIFMSGTDRRTQANYFYQPWQFAAVFNPQAERWGAFIGENAEECLGSLTFFGEGEAV